MRRCRARPIGTRLRSARRDVSRLPGDLCPRRRAQAKPLRVCSDPENMPFSNQKLEGFENRIASLIAKELGTTVSYVWWGQRRGFIRNTMNATLQEGRCDRRHRRA